MQKQDAVLNKCCELGSVKADRRRGTDAGLTLTKLTLPSVM
jgi:hypothetical protein